MRERVVITGTGAVSGAGRDPASMLGAILEGRSAIRAIEGWDTTGWPVTHAAEIPAFNARALVDDRKLHKFIRRTDLVGIYAGDRAAEAAGYAAHRESLSPEASAQFADRTGIYVGSGGGAFENQYDYFPLMSEAHGDLVKFGSDLADTVNPMWLLRTLPNNVLCHVGIRNRLKGTNACITNHSVGGTLAVIEALEALRTGEADRALAIGHDTPIEPQNVLYYHECGLLGANRLRPFDASRSGSLFGEGAGAFALETQTAARERRAPVVGSTRWASSRAPATMSSSGASTTTGAISRRIRRTSTSARTASTRARAVAARDSPARTAFTASSRTSRLARNRLGSVTMSPIAVTIGVDTAYGWLLALAIGLALGVLIGALQGFIIAYIGIPSFVVTLGGLLIFRGMVWVISGGATQAPNDKQFGVMAGGPEGSLGGPLSWALGIVFCVAIVLLLVYARRQRRRFNFPVRPIWAEIVIGVIGCAVTLAAVFVANSYKWPQGLVDRHLAEDPGFHVPPGGLDSGIPWPIVMLLAVTVLMTILATRRRFGRYVFAIGGNPEAAELGGINTRWTVMKTYILMGVLCAISAAITSARLNGASNDVGEGYELYVIAAAVIGGTSFAGGIGTISGAVLGAMVMYTLKYGLSFIGLESPIQDIVAGIVLIIAVGFDTLNRRRVR